MNDKINAPQSAIHANCADSHGTWKGYSFRFIPGNVNGNKKMFVQTWLTNAAFSVVKQAWFDEYAFKFKGSTDYQQLPDGLKTAIDYTYKALFNPVRKDFRKPS